MHGRAHHGRWVIALVVATVPLGALSACGEDDPREPGSGVELPDLRGADDFEDVYDGPLDAGFREEVGIYSGQEVTLSAEVAEVLSPRMFTVTAPDGSDVEPLLAIATPKAVGPAPEPGERVLLAATPTADFDADQVSAAQGLDADGERYEEWEDDTYLLVTRLRPAS